MFICSSSAQMHEIFKEKCLKGQTFKRVQRRDKISLVNSRGVTEYVLYVNHKKIYNNSIPKNKIAVLYKAVKKAYHEFIIKHDFEIPTVVRNTTQVRGKNNILFDSIDTNGTFYNVDISHCYWQIGYKIGMLSESLYKKYNDDSQLKRLRNMSYTAVLAPTEVTYTVNGRYAGTIKNDTSIYNKVYTLIRHTCYNIIGEVKRLLENRWIEYNIDGISVFPEELEIVENKFKELGYLYKVKECVKINNYQYITVEDAEIHNFYLEDKNIFNRNNLTVNNLQI